MRAKQKRQQMYQFMILNPVLSKKRVFWCDADHFVQHMRTVNYLYTQDVLITDCSYLETTEYGAAG